MICHLNAMYLAQSAVTSIFFFAKLVLVTAALEHTRPVELICCQKQHVCRCLSGSHLVSTILCFTSLLLGDRCDIRSRETIKSQLQVEANYFVRWTLNGTGAESRAPRPQWLLGVEHSEGPQGRIDRPWLAWPLVKFLSFAHGSQNIFETTYTSCFKLITIYPITWIIKKNLINIPQSLYHPLSLFQFSIFIPEHMVPQVNSAPGASEKKKTCFFWNYYNTHKSVFFMGIYCLGCLKKKLRGIKVRAGGQGWASASR